MISEHAKPRYSGQVESGVLYFVVSGKSAIYCKFGLTGI